MDELERFAKAVARAGGTCAAAPSIDYDTGEYGVMLVDIRHSVNGQPVFASTFILETQLDEFLASVAFDPVCVKLVRIAAARIPQYRAEKEN